MNARVLKARRLYDSLCGWSAVDPVLGEMSVFGDG